MFLQREFEPIVQLNFFVYLQRLNLKFDYRKVSVSSTFKDFQNVYEGKISIFMYCDLWL